MDRVRPWFYRARPLLSVLGVKTATAVTAHRKHQVLSNWGERLRALNRGIHESSDYESINLERVAILLKRRYEQAEFKITYYRIRLQNWGRLSRGMLRGR
jgi:hypothetical protein